MARQCSSRAGRQTWEPDLCWGRKGRAGRVLPRGGLCHPVRLLGAELRGPRACPRAGVNTGGPSPRAGEKTVLECLIKRIGSRRRTTAFKEVGLTRRRDENKITSASHQSHGKSVWSRIKLWRGLYVKTGNAW